MPSSHYFINDSSLNREIKYLDYRFGGTDFRFATHTGVFSKDRVDYATDILLNAIPPLSGSLLDLGCGYGVVGIVLSKVRGLTLTQSDVNRAALELTRTNCDYNGVASVIIESDCFTNITGKFDTIVLNPPIHAGKAVTYTMYEQSLEHLSLGGKLYVVTLKKHGAESTLAKLCEVFDGNSRLIHKKKGIFVIESTSL
jgi:16S rRNA (guanine1207-N2)-methyltransferase